MLPKKANHSPTLRSILKTFLLNVKEASTRRHTNVKKSCDNALKQLDKAKKIGAKLNSADTFFEPFRLACNSKHVGLVKVSLDAISKLIAGGYLTGDAILSSKENNINENTNENNKQINDKNDKNDKNKNKKYVRKLIDIIIQTVCECSNLQQLHLQIVQTLVSIGCSGNCKVHGSNLLRLLQCVYGIYLRNNNISVSMSAKAVLNQVLIQLFQNTNQVNHKLTNLKEIENKKRFKLQTQYQNQREFSHSISSFNQQKHNLKIIKDKPLLDINNNSNNNSNNNNNNTKENNSIKNKNDETENSSHDSFVVVNGPNQIEDKQIEEDDVEENENNKEGSVDINKSFDEKEDNNQNNNNNIENNNKIDNNNTTQENNNENEVEESEEMEDIEKIEKTDVIDEKVESTQDIVSSLLKSLIDEVVKLHESQNDSLIETQTESKTNESNDEKKENKVENVNSPNDKESTLILDDEIIEQNEILETPPMSPSDVYPSKNDLKSFDDNKLDNIKEESSSDVASYILNNILLSAYKISGRQKLKKLADKYKKRGNQKYGKQKYNEALTLYKKAYDIYPYTASYLVNQAVTYYVLDELNNSKLLCVKAIEQGNKNIENNDNKSENNDTWLAKSYSTLAHVSFKEGNINHCIRFYKLSLKYVEDKKIKKKFSDIISNYGDNTNKNINNETFYNNFVKHLHSIQNQITPKQDSEIEEKKEQNSRGRTHSRESSSDSFGRSNSKIRNKSPIPNNIKELEQLLKRLRKDCMIILNELCRLSAAQKVDKKILGDYNFKRNINFNSPFGLDNNNIPIKSREMALLLLNQSLKSIPPFLSKDQRFLDLIRTSLVPTLCVNTASTLKNVIKNAMNIFKTLVTRSCFKINLRAENGILFDSILDLASTYSSTFNQKLEVIKALDYICNNGKITIALFLNYDCRNESNIVFQRIIKTIEALSQSKLRSKDWISPEEELILKRHSLKCFVNIVNGLLQFKNELLGESNKNGSENIRNNSNSLLNSPQQSMSVNESKSSEREDSYSESNTRNDELISNENSISGYHSISRISIKENIESSWQREKLLSNGIVKFNIKPKSGIKYLVSHKLLKHSINDICNFLFKYKQLSKVQIGEYLGEDKAFNKKLMQHYIHHLKLSDLNICKALRYLCSLFWLPGEAQKIDRILQVWADRYIEENPNEYPNADVVYILGFSAIMLNVNLYSANVKKKMTKEEFTSQNKLALREHLDELPSNIFSFIYDNIKNEEMKLKSDSDSNVNSKKLNKKAVLSNKYANLRKTTKDILKKAQQKTKYLPKNKSFMDEVYFNEYNADETVFQLIFSNETWRAALATFSVGLSNSNLEEHIDYCLDGYRLCIKLSGELDMNMECNAFVGSLAKFTLLGTSQPMEQKNIKAIKILLDIAYQDGNCLHSSWEHILRCISQIEILFLMESHAYVGHTKLENVEIKDNKNYNSDKNSSNISREDSIINNINTNDNIEKTRFQSITNVGKDGILRFESSYNAQIVSSEIPQSLVDKIFTKSNKLNSESILSFVKHLCQVSRKELASVTNPRLYCLQKIVEIAHYNMDRIKYEWLKIWNLLSDHFCLAGCHENPHVSMDAINSLRQLADQFLEKDELTNFNFQKSFLKPFKLIMLRTNNVEIKELIIQCIERLIKARYKNIKSGWKNVFAILGLGARNTNEQLVASTYDTLISTLDLYFPLIKKLSNRPDVYKYHNTSNNDNNNIGITNNSNLLEQVKHLKLLRTDALSDCVDTLIAFTQNDFTDLSINAIDYLSKIAQYLFERDSVLDSNNSENNDNNNEHLVDVDIDNTNNDSELLNLSNSLSGGIPNMGRPLIKAWFLCLLGLSKGVNSERLEVRTHSFQVLFRLLRVHGIIFDKLMWKRAFQRLIFPIFKELRNTNFTTTNNNNINDDEFPDINESAGTILERRETLSNVKTINRGSPALTPIVSNEKLNFNNVGNNGSRGRRKRSNSNADERAYTPDDSKLQINEKNNNITSRKNYSVYSEFSWLETTCHPVLSAMVELFSQYFHKCKHLLKDVVQLFTNFIVLKANNREASEIGFKCLKRLLNSIGNKFLSYQWNIVINDIINTLNHSVPKALNSVELFNYFGIEIKNKNKLKVKSKKPTQNGHNSNNNIPKNILNIKLIIVSSESVLKILSQLLIISNKYLNKLTREQVISILQSFENTHEFIYSITRNNELMLKLNNINYTYTNNNSDNSINNSKSISLTNLLYKIESMTIKSSLQLLYTNKLFADQLKLKKSKSKINLLETLQNSDITKLKSSNNVPLYNMVRSKSDNISDDIGLNTLDNTLMQKSSHNSNNIIFSYDDNNLISSKLNNSINMQTSDNILNELDDKKDNLYNNKNNNNTNINIENEKVKLITIIDMISLYKIHLIPKGVKLIHLITDRQLKLNNNNKYSILLKNNTKYLIPTVITFLKYLLNKNDFNDKNFKSSLKVLFPYLNKLILCNNNDIRQLVYRLFQDRIYHFLINNNLNNDSNSNSFKIESKN